MITPVIQVRWSFADSVEICSGEGKYINVGGQTAAGCFLVTEGVYESAATAREECMQKGGDLASASNINDLCLAIEEFQDTSLMWVSGDSNFWNSSHYLANINNPILLNQATCKQENSSQSARGLCVYPTLKGEAQKYCEEDEPRPNRYPGYIWNTAEAGFWATNVCPFDWTGYASRWCSENGTWEEFLDLR